MSRFLLVAIMRNEAPYILEWVAHHRAIGFTDILVFTNDCTDGTDQMLERLMDRHLVIHCPNPKAIFAQLGNLQVSALRYASTFGLFGRADLVCTIDADEFIEVSVGDGTLPALINAAGPFDALSFPVVGYCSDARAQVGDGDVQRRFVQPRPNMTPGEDWNAPVMAVKTINRPNIPKAQFRNHRPKVDGFSRTGLVWLDGSGQAMPPAFTDDKVNAFAIAARPTMAHVNHHSLRSRNGFVLKALRGDAVTADRLGVETKKQIDNAIKYWRARNQSVQPARQPHLPPDEAAMLADLHADPVLGPLHDRACAMHDQIATDLLASPAGRQFLDGLSMQ